MKSLQTFIYFCLMMVLPVELYAQNQLTQLVQQTLNANPQLKEQEQAVSIAEHRTQLTRSQYLPQVSFESTYNYVYPVPEVQLALPGLEGSGFTLQPQNNYQTAITLNQRLYDFGKTSSTVQQTRIEKDLNLKGLEKAHLQIAYQVAQLYFNAIYLKKSIKVQEAQVQLLLDNEKLIENRIEDGNEIAYNLIATQVRRKNAEIRLADLNNQFQRQLISLKNLSIATTIEINENLSFQGIVANPSQADLSSENLDVKISQLQEKRALEELNGAKKTALPDVFLQGSAGFRNGIQPDIDDFQFNYAIGLRLSVPLFTGFRNKNQTNISKANYELRKYATDNQKLIVKTASEQVYDDLLTAQDKLTKSKAQVEQAKYALELADVRYENGIITNLDVSTAQTALLEAELNQVTYAYQVLLAQLAWHRLKGTKFWEE